MSIQFSDTVHKNGIMQLIERFCGFNDGDITGNATLMAQFTGDVNLTLDEIFGFMFPLGGTWQLDDSNQTDYPFIQTSLVSGRRDYTFLTDGSGNIILDIYRVMVADQNGVFQDVDPVDQDTANNSNSNTTGFIDGRNQTGAPTKYDKIDNGIILDPIPNYNLSGGLKVFINREATYFTISDTTKKAGFAYLFHEYLALSPSYKYARLKNLANKEDLKIDMLNMAEAIKKYYGKREKDVPGRLRPRVESTK